MRKQNLLMAELLSNAIDGEHAFLSFFDKSSV
jgi:hypothetical protein